MGGGGFSFKTAPLPPSPFGNQLHESVISGARGGVGFFKLSTGRPFEEDSV